MQLLSLYFENVHWRDKNDHYKSLPLVVRLHGVLRHDSIQVLAQRDRSLLKPRKLNIAKSSS